MLIQEVGLEGGPEGRGRGYDGSEVVHRSHAELKHPPTLLLAWTHTRSNVFTQFQLLPFSGRHSRNGEFFCLL